LSGRRTIGKCGHESEYVIGQFLQCLRPSCDGLARCDKCGSTKIEPFKAEHIPDGAVHCVDCGRVRWSGTTIG